MPLRCPAPSNYAIPRDASRRLIGPFPPEGSVDVIQLPDHALIIAVQHVQSFGGIGALEDGKAFIEQDLNGEQPGKNPVIHNQCNLVPLTSASPNFR